MIAVILSACWTYDQMQYYSIQGFTKGALSLEGAVFTYTSATT